MAKGRTVSSWTLDLCRENVIGPGIGVVYVLRDSSREVPEPVTVGLIAEPLQEQVRNNILWNEGRTRIEHPNGRCGKERPANGLARHKVREATTLQCSRLVGVDQCRNQRGAIAEIENFDRFSRPKAGHMHGLESWPAKFLPAHPERSAKVERWKTMDAIPLCADFVAEFEGDVKEFASRVRYETAYPNAVEILKVSRDVMLAS